MPENIPDTALNQWSAQASALGAVKNPLRVPYDVYLHEAASVAGFVKRRWLPEGDVPGLSHAAQRVPLETSVEVPALVRAVQEAQTNLLLLVDPAASNHGERALRD